MSDVDTKGVRRRKRWPEALKREIVTATYLPGASVSVVARRYDVNANQVFSWRRRYREAGEALPSASSPASSSTMSSTPRLVPVTITTDPEDSAAVPPASAATETIEIDVLDRYRVRVGSHFETQTLGRIIDVLNRAARGRRR